MTLATVSEERTRESFDLRVWRKASKAKWNATARAQKRGGVCELTTVWIATEFEKLTCSQTGLPLSLDPDPERLNPWSPSLGRVDHKNPNYTTDNTRIVANVINRMQSAASEQDLLLVCMALLKKRDLI